ncbi:MAG: hypothetical protein RL684_3310 [Pseudomonadota bacterium]|jgi:hypothetical protein
MHLAFHTKLIILAVWTLAVFGAGILFAMHNPRIAAAIAARVAGLRK